MTVDTRHVKDRRHLEFSSLDDIRAEVERLARGKIRALGNWSPGQVFEHLAIVMNASIDGFPFTAPLPMRVMARLFKRRFLSRPMPPGFRLPGRAAPLLPPPVSLEDGLAAIRRALDRQRTEPGRQPHAFFGPLTREEWDRVHCLHSAMHLGFLVPAE